MSWENILKIQLGNDPSVIDNLVYELIIDKIRSNHVDREPKNVSVNKNVDIFRITGTITSEPLTRGPDGRFNDDIQGPLYRYDQNLLIEARLTVYYNEKKVADYYYENDIYERKHNPRRKYAGVEHYNVEEENIPEGYEVGPVGY